MIRFCLLASLLSMLLVAPVMAQREASERTEQRLKRMLEQYPAADANQDGKLTEQEARDYAQKLRQRSTSTSRAPAVKPTHADVKYGRHDRNVLDFYQATSDKPTPILIYIHGGGFVAGNKNSFNAAMLAQILDAGISFASIHYRFVDGEQTIFPAPQLDGARAVQFLRSKAGEWNIDPARVGCFGGSAGAGISMWIGFHEDLARPDSTDPVERQSTRIQAVGTFGGQGTYDPIAIKQLVGGRAWEHPSLLKVYGLKTADEALSPTPQQRKLYAEASAITHLTAGDPPLYMVYSEPDIVPPADSRPGQFIHHPNFGKQLKQKMDALRIENVYVHTSDTGANPIGGMFEFFKKHLK